MKLLELYEEIFQYVCRLNRMAKTQAHPEFARVHPAAWVSTYGAAEHGEAPDESDLDRNVLQRLRSLGYIN